MAYANPDALVGTEWLAAHLDDPGIRIVDGTYMMPMWNRNARAEHEARHIPGAVLFDIDAVSDNSNPLPHMLPSAEEFATHATALGLDDDARIIVYDAHGMMSAARVWWTLRVFGHAKVAVLDGGLPKWVAEGRPVESGPARPRAGRFTARLAGDRVRDAATILADIPARREQIVDARAAGRFTGEEEEVWPGRRRGHIPGSLNLPFTELLDPATKTFLPAEALRARMDAAGIDATRPVVTSCGSGVTAAVIALALHLVGRDDVSLYDGSWAEWGLREDLPVETGPARK